MTALSYEMGPAAGVDDAPFAAVLRGFVRSSRTRDALFRASDMEAWVEWESDDFFDLAQLADFRRNKLGRGTMNWPNRRLDSVRYVVRDGTLERVSPPTIGAWRRRYEDARGYEYLLRTFLTCRRTMPPGWLDVVSDSLVGRPYRLRLPGGRILTEPVLRHAWYLGRMARLAALSRTRPIIALEIGPGYGGLARLIALAIPGSTIVLVDLPQRLSLQAYYLSHSLPTARLVVSDEAAVITEALTGQRRADFVLTPPWGAEGVPDHACDLVVNTHSLHEMSRAQVAYYVGHVRRICRGHFYCVNRVEKAIGAETVHHPREALRDWRTVHESPQTGYPDILEGLYARAAV